MVMVTGEKYGRLTALRLTERDERSRARWTFLCDCGKETVADAYLVRVGKTLSCGCWRRERSPQNSITHGHSRERKMSRTFRAWIGAKDRCFNPNRPNYYRYGGRGILMCAAWKDSFEQFLADMGECPPGRSLDRINNSGSYEPGNCRWATPSEQARNRRRGGW